MEKIIVFEIEPVSEHTIIDIARAPNWSEAQYPETGLLY